MIDNRKSKGKWPKTPPVLTEEQIRISDDWMKYWFTINREKFSGVIDFGHKYVVRHRGEPGGRTVEIGAGLGEQLDYEPESITPKYIGIEYRSNMAEALHERFPQISCFLADCQGLLPFASASMDRVIAIHTLEHLPDLPRCLKEIRRILTPAGKLFVVIPCEGGLAYAVARHFTTKRAFEKRYQTSYEWHIRSEHVNKAWEVLEELQHLFHFDHQSYYPFHLPFIHLNAVIGLTLSPR